MCSLCHDTEADSLGNTGGIMLLWQCFWPEAFVCTGHRRPILITMGFYYECDSTNAGTGWDTGGMFLILHRIAWQLGDIPASDCCEPYCQYERRKVQVLFWIQPLFCVVSCARCTRESDNRLVDARLSDRVCARNHRISVRRVPIVSTRELGWPRFPLPSIVVLML